VGEVIGMPVVPANLQSISSKLLALSYKRKDAFVCIANVHMLITAKKNKLLSSAMEAAAIVTSDGMPLVWELRRQGFKEAERVSGPDLMMELCERAQGENIPIYFYGGSPSVVDIMKGKLVELFPDLMIAGIESPPMLPDVPEVDQVVMDRIKDSGAKVVFVGLGCPKQELCNGVRHELLS